MVEKTRMGKDRIMLEKFGKTFRWTRMALRIDSLWNVSLRKVWNNSRPETDCRPLKSRRN